jgi:hypothetical protein
MIAASACATVGIGPDLQGRFDRGLTELARQNYTAANQHLEWVSAASGSGDPIAPLALLVRAVAAADPRNPGRDLDRAQDLAAQLRDARHGWAPPAGESLRLIIAELESATARAAAAEAARDASLSVSSVVQRTLYSRFDSVRVQRDTLRRTVTHLEQQLADREKTLKEKEQELERIRKIVRN